MPELNQIGLVVVFVVVVLRVGVVLHRHSQELGTFSHRVRSWNPGHRRYWSTRKNRRVTCTKLWLFYPQRLINVLPFECVLVSNSSMFLNEMFLGSGSPKPLVIAKSTLQESFDLGKYESSSISSNNSHWFLSASNLSNNRDVL